MNERGSVTVWMMGVAGLIVVMAGLAVDVWRLVDARERLAGRADAAAVAIASTIDSERWRSDGELVVDEGGCTRLDEPAMRSCVVDGDEVEVALSGRFELTVTRVLHPDPIEIRATAVARAVRP